VFLVDEYHIDAIRVLFPPNTKHV